jgi:hypothetical protein
MKRNSMKYIVVVADDPNQLAKFVEEKLDDGFELLGGVAVNMKGMYLQAMVKYTPVEKAPIPTPIGTSRKP